MKTRMTFPLITLCLLLSTSFIYGQKCEIKADPITGEQTIQFKNKYQTLRFENKGTELTDFYTTFSYRGEQNVTVLKGSEVVFKLKNGKIITLTSIADATPQTRLISETTIVSNYTYAFKITKEQINDLASDKIDFIRYPSMDGGTVDLDVKGLGKIYASKITKGAQCMSENL